MIDTSSALLLLTPSLLVGAAAGICGVPRDAGERVQFRPPPIVFSVIWPALLLLLGITLCRSEVRWPGLLLTLGLAAWIAIYSPRCGGRRRAAVWVLAVDLWLALMAFGLAVRDADGFNVFSTSAIVAWLTFALLLNATEMQVLGANS